MGPDIIVPVLGIMAGIIIPVSVFIWLYFESKDKNKTILEISKNIDDPSKMQDLIGIVLYDPLGLLFNGTGLIVIGLGLICMLVSYKYSNEVEVVNKAVERFEKR